MCTHHTLTFDELGLEGWGVATKVNVGTLLQDERVFLIKWVTTWSKMHRKQRKYFEPISARLVFYSASTCPTNQEYQVPLGPGVWVVAYPPVFPGDCPCCCTSECHTHSDLLCPGTLVETYKHRTFNILGSRFKAKTWTTVTVYNIAYLTPSMLAWCGLEARCSVGYTEDKGNIQRWRGCWGRV